MGLSQRPSRLYRSASNTGSIEIGATDANVTRWPKTTIPEPNKDGTVNFMRPVATEEEASIRWRTVIGQALAEKLRYPDFGTGSNNTNCLHSLTISLLTATKNWILGKWPTHYNLYEQNKGKLNGNGRRDLYLIGEFSRCYLNCMSYILPFIQGSTNVARFRSPQEFVPHAYWLMTNLEQDRSKCGCRHCSGRR